LAIVAVLAAIPPAIATQPWSLAEEKAWRMLQLAYQAREKANQTIAIAEASGVSAQALEEAEAAYARGEASLASANETFYALRGQAPVPPGETPKDERVQALALQAMHEFKAAIAALTAEIEGPDESTSPRGLGEAIARAEVYLEKATASVEALRAARAELDLTQIDEEIAEARLHIGYARANLTAGDINGTAHELGEIRRTLSELSGELNRLAHAPRLEQGRIRAFLDRQLPRKLDEVRQLAELAGVDRTAELAEVNGKIEAARQAAESGNLKESLDLTREAHRLLMDLFNELHRGGGRP